MDELISFILKNLDNNNLTNEQQEFFIQYANLYTTALGRYTNNSHEKKYADELKILSEIITIINQKYPTDENNPIGVKIIKNNILKYYQEIQEKIESNSGKSKSPTLSLTKNGIPKGLISDENGYAKICLVIFAITFLGIILGYILFKTK